MKSNILIIDTSMPHLSLAISSGNEIVYETTVEEEYEHARIITRKIEEALKCSQIEANELCAIAINAGPGSFTGLRIGSSVSKGLCYGLEIPLISLVGIEEYGKFESKNAVQKNKNLFILLDARRDNYFYTQVKDGQVIEKVRWASYTEINTKIMETKEAVMWKCGGKNELSFSAGKLIEGTMKKWQNQEFEDIATFEPNYYLNNYVKNAIST